MGATWVQHAKAIHKGKDVSIVEIEDEIYKVLNAYLQKHVKKMDSSSLTIYLDGLYNTIKALDEKIHAINSLKKKT